ncbi:hypothetical protein [uncultured Pseudomonas sp.]|uniref:hypothetical protein n=1 Tax=uncultured Pseudomonas sp. TaxID=114707 RepID=UPI0025F34445|nr:hypothetical protein [uncultured Pseudomonas sp.]
MADCLVSRRGAGRVPSGSIERQRKKHGSDWPYCPGPERLPEESLKRMKILKKMLAKEKRFY